MGEKQQLARVYTISTRLEMHGELKEYLEEYIKVVSHWRRVMIQDIRNDVVEKKYEGKASKYVTDLCNQSGLYSYTISGLNLTLRGQLNAYYALKKHEMSMIGTKVHSLEGKIARLEATINELKPLVTANEATPAKLQTYRNSKIALYHAKNKKNALLNEIENIKQLFQGDKKRISIACGSKKVFNKQYSLKASGYASHDEWYEDYVKSRDAYIPFVGHAVAYGGNHVVQVTHIEGNKFSLSLLKDKPFQKKGDKKLVVPEIRFKYLSDWYAQALKGNQPVSYTITRRGDKWYLLASFSHAVDVCTSKESGVIACSYRSNAIDMVELDEKGDVAHMKTYPLNNKGVGGRAKTEAQRSIHSLIQYCKDSGKDLVIDDIKLEKKKASKLKAEDGNKYEKAVNRGIHAFDYSRYKTLCSDIGKKYGVVVVPCNRKDTFELEEDLANKLGIERGHAVAILLGRKYLKS